MTYNTPISYNDIKILCEKAAQSCIEKITNDMQLSNEISIINQEKKLQQNSLIVDKTPKVEGLVKYWSDFEVGKQYYLWARRITNSNKKIYILKYLIKELNGDTLNICIMKQQEGPQTKIFTLTESDCEHIGIDFEDGLEVYPANLFWVKL